MKDPDLLSLIEDVDASDYAEIDNNSGLVEVDFSGGAVILKATANKNDAITAKELKTVVK